MCGDSWDLDEQQLWKLNECVKENGSNIEGGNLIADIGYSVCKETADRHALMKEEMRDYFKSGIGW
jgi:hypothetical protein